MIQSFTIRVEINDPNMERISLVRLFQEALMRKDIQAMLKLTELITDVRSP